MLDAHSGFQKANFKEYLKRKGDHGVKGTF